MARTAELLSPATGRWTVTGDPLERVMAGRGPSGMLIAPLRDVTDLDPVARSLGLSAAELVATYTPVLTSGAVTTIALLPDRYAVATLALVGVGDDVADWRAGGAAAGRAAGGRAPVTLALPAGLTDDEAGAFIEGLALGSVRPRRWDPKGPLPRSHKALDVAVVGGLAERVVDRALRRAAATALARDLANAPGNVKNPAWFAAVATAVAAKSGLGVTVWTERDLRRRGFGALLAVGAGSASPPRFVELSYTPKRRKKSPHIVLVGKGVTFDTGGLNVKPPALMLGMHTDCSGAAVVLAVLRAAAEARLPVRVTGLLPLAENSVGAHAMRPGDVITHVNGLRTEVTNTDAEGRLVLADALAYAHAALSPDVIVDIATLTGAARMALGRSLAPIFSNDPELSHRLVAAGERSGETLWPLPLHAAYRQGLDSDVADLRHFNPEDRGAAGAVMGALFLQEFVGDRSWAHLDIAGAGRSETDSGLLAKGATGFGTRLLLQWLEEMS